MLKPIHRARPICLWCNRRPALARVRGEWRVVKHHDVCRQCWRSFMDSRAASKLAQYERERLEADRNSRRRGTLRASRSRAGARGTGVDVASLQAERALRAR
jgi:hypothetical protein